MIHCPNCEASCGNSTVFCLRCGHALAAIPPSPPDRFIAFLGEALGALWRALCAVLWLIAVGVLLTANNPTTATQAGFVAVMLLFVIARRSDG